MAKRGPRSQRTVLPLLAVEDLRQAAGSFESDYAADSESRVPLRAFLETKSSFEFIAELVQEAEVLLLGLGLGAPGEMANAAIAMALADPTVSMFCASDAKNHRVLQAVAVRAPDGSAEGIDICLVVTAVIAPQTFAGTLRVPPRVLEHEVTVELFDLDDAHEIARLADEVQRWSRAYPAPHGADRDVQGAVVLLGDLARHCLHGTPDDWRDQLQRLIASFGMRALLIGNGEKFNGDVAGNTVLAIQFEPYGGLSPELPDGVDLVEIPPHTCTFDEVRARVCEMLASEPEEHDSASIVELQAGQRLFHRKVGNSRKFDRFDAGSANSCSHGGVGFVRFRGPKSIKGFERRYSNFDPAMLHHCGKYPNCGMYAVFA